MLSNYKKIKNLANKIKIANGSGNPFAIAKLNNIYIMEYNYKKQLGAFSIVNKIPFIFLNTNISDEEKRNVVAHELGHFFLHKKYLKDLLILRDYSLFSKQENIMEMEANLFAGYLLVDTDELSDKLLENKSIKELANYFSVDEKFIKLLALYI